MVVKTRTIQNGRIAIIELRGTLVGDDDTDQFRNSVADLIEQGNKFLIVNLQRINYMNSSGIGALIAAHTSYARNKGEVKLTGVSGNIQSLLAVTRLVDVFDVHDSVDEAVDHFMTTNTNQ